MDKLERRKYNKLLAAIILRAVADMRSSDSRIRDPAIAFMQEKGPTTLRFLGFSHPEKKVQKYISDANTEVYRNRAA